MISTLELKNTIFKFVNDIKWGNQVSTENLFKLLQQNINTEMAKGWQMKFITDQCDVVNIVKKNNSLTYSLQIYTQDLFLKGKN